MKKIFEMTDPAMIHAILDQAEYGTLAVSEEETPMQHLSILSVLVKISIFMGHSAAER